MGKAKARQKKRNAQNTRRQEEKRIEKEKMKAKVDKWTWAMMLGLLVVIVLLFVIGNKVVNLITGSKKATEPVEAAQTEAYGVHHVAIDIRDYGTIEIELDGDTAPITVRNFIELAQNGFYDGLTFHRIMDGFMMQGGDPEGNGTGGSDTKIKGEFSANGVENNISHVRGVISMARSSASYDSASSQFFIVQSDSTFLDGQYAGFGHVTLGMEIVDEICKNAPVTDDNGSVPAEAQPIIDTIRVID